jgi:hypothetical protein
MTGVTVRPRGQPKKRLSARMFFYEADRKGARGPRDAQRRASTSTVILGGCSKAEFRAQPPP